MEIVCCLSLGAIADHYVAPLALQPGVERVWVVRPGPLARADLPKVAHVSVASPLLTVRLLRALWACIRLARRPQVAALVSFNPLPY
ncbi:MAG: hypothetical protein ACRDHL_04415, partial [Candidatus Promineifilaceae bacterium]